MRRIIVAGIGTDVGKTVASAIVVHALQADYWKPVQCGNLEDSDTDRVKKWSDAVCFPESYRLQHPLSPHHAAKLENISIRPEKIQPPQTNRSLVIEMAGGLLVPYQDHLLQIDLFAKWDCEWILVSQNYLGSINHTLLSLEILKSRSVKLLGVVFNGVPYPEGEKVIHQKMIGRILPEKNITKPLIQRYAKEWLL